MTRIDHVAEAMKLRTMTARAMLPEQAVGILAAAQLHATLALVEQQRIANLIAYLPYEDGYKASWVEIEAALGLTAEQEGETVE